MTSKETHNFNLKTISDGFLNNLNIQKGFIRTLIDLIIRPNNVFKDYITGGKEKYFSPARYFITIISLYGIIETIFPTSLESNIIPISEVQYLPEHIKAVIQFLNNTPLLYLFLFIIPYTIMSRVIFFNKNKNIAMYIVVNIYITCSAVMVISLIGIPLNILANEIVEHSVFFAFILAYLILYYIYCYTKFLALNPIYGFFKISSSLLLIMFLISMFFSKLVNILYDSGGNWILKPFGEIRASRASVWFHDATCPNKRHTSEKLKKILSKDYYGD